MKKIFVEENFLHILEKQNKKFLGPLQWCEEHYISSYIHLKSIDVVLSFLIKLIKIYF